MLQNILAFYVIWRGSSYNFVKRYLQVIRQDAAQTKTFRWRRSARRSSSPQMNGLVFFFRFNVNVSFKSLKYESSGKVERLIVPALQPLSPVRMASLPSANLSMEANTSNNTSKAVTAMPGNPLLSFLHQTLLLLALRPTPSETKILNSKPFQRLDICQAAVFDHIFARGQSPARGEFLQTASFSSILTTGASLKPWVYWGGVRRACRKDRVS